MKRIIFLWFPFLLPFFLHAEGTKQLKPDSNYFYYLSVQWQGGGPECFGMESCDLDHRIYVHINNPSEKIYIGFADQNPNHVVGVKLKLNGILMYGPVNVFNGTKGFIKFFSQAYAGPDVLSPAGYLSISYAPPVPGDYEIDFADPNFPNNMVPLNKFDITVIDTTIFPLTAINGRLWAKKWINNTSSITVPTNAFLGTLYIYSDDSIVTSIFFNSMQGHYFTVSCNSNGCFPPPIPWDSACKSTSGEHVYPQYKIFVSNPDTISYPTGILGTINPNTTNVTAGCDGSFTINFWVSKPGTVKAVFDVNPLPGIQPEDVIIMDSVQAGWNTFYWNGLNGQGLPLAGGTQVFLTLTYVNGLTNLPIYDVERQEHGFVITQVRPPGPPIVSYWNDTLLASKGGKTQLTGCYSSDTVGCHRWNGNYSGVGIGSLNTVNTWWYAASSWTNPMILTVQLGTGTPADITGPLTFCGNSVGIYKVVPDPLPGADPGKYEWVLTDDATATVLFDSIDQPDSIIIAFSLYPPGNYHLKVRGFSAVCGYGPFGPGPTGEGIQLQVMAAPQITNATRTFSICSGDMITINLQSSLPSTTYSYTATATSTFISGYSGGSANPIQQPLVNNGTAMDSVIYRVIPYSFSCPGDTVSFYVEVTPVPQITNTDTSYEVCSGDTTHIVLTATIPSAMFSWTAVGSDPSVSGYFNSYGTVIAQTLINTGMTNQTVTYTVTPFLGTCSGIQKIFIVTVTPGQPVSVSITVSANPVCAGTSVTFFANPVYGGLLPIYQWKVNGVNAGNNNPVYTYTPVNGDMVICVLTSSNITCVTNNPATSNQIIMVIDSNLVIGVTIVPSANPVCAGIPVIFTATPVNGGANPFYQWKVNGASVGMNSPVFTYIPATGDVVICILTSAEVCTANNPVTSSPVIMVIKSNPVVTFSKCNDTITTTNAKPFRLKGGIPLGGVYTGSGVNPATGIYNPAAAGSGTHQITYSYTNSLSCSASAHISIFNFQFSIFNCGSTLTDIRDNRTYQTVQIGSQCWMAENLNYGTETPDNIVQRDNCVPERYRNPASVYQWDELMQYDDTPGLQGLCPPGWHVPDETEWNILISYYQGFGFAASPLLSTGYSGFNVLVTGSRFMNSGWNYIDFATHLWTSTAWGLVKAWAHAMNNAPDDHSVSTYPATRSNAFSVRCLKD